LRADALRATLGKIMDRLATNPEKRKGLQTIAIFLIVCLVIVLGVSAVIYFINQDNELMPDARPANPLDEKH
jgi:hypothetical protein